MKFNMQAMLEQAQKMQQEMERVKQQVSQMRVSAESGGGLVKVTMSGDNKLVDMKISAEIVNPDDIEMLEDLVLAAVNKAADAAQSMVANEMGKVTNMLPNIPGMDFGLGG
jgi:nucleoid-associated protein EbfC